MMHDQLILDFTSAAAERLALVRGVRNICWPGVSRGRLDGAAELLERLLVLGGDGDRDRWETVAQVTALAARIAGRRTVQERTVRNWAATARGLGVLEVDCRAHELGFRHWNRYTIRLDLLRGLVTPTDPRRIMERHTPPTPPADLVGGNGRKWAETIAAPRAETIAALLTAKQKSALPPPPTPPHDWAAAAAELRKRGILVPGSAIREARRNGLHPDQVEALCRAYDAHPAGQYGPPALHWRIRHALPGDDPAAGWPAPAAPTRRPADPATRQNLARQTRLWVLIKDGRRRGLTDADISAAARAELGADFCAAEGW